MRIVLLVAFILCSILCITVELIFPLEPILQIALNLCALLSGLLMFPFFITHENRLKTKIKEYYQSSFLKDDAIKKIEKEVDQKNDIILAFKTEIKEKDDVINTLKNKKDDTEEINELKNKNSKITGELNDKEIKIKIKETEILNKENEISKLKLEVRNWCEKVEELNLSIAKPSENTVIVDNNHIEDDADESNKTKKECLEFLEMIKWSNHNFNCSKCENTTFNTLKNLNSRKCTKCNHIESAMAHTLYMGVRFPLDKAFDMTKLVIANPKILIEELIEVTGLTKNTCWKFKNKILDQRLAYKKKFKRLPEHWEELIYF